MLADSGLIRQLWVPPFPNDSGGAIGAIAAHLFATSNVQRLRWDIYAGPELIVNAPPDGWASRRCSPEELGELLAATGRPCVVMQGRSELGPRALGHRSVLMSPHARASEMLNDAKGRESYRPIAPVCLEDWASEIFDPGGTDPYMLFEHRVRRDWRSRVPGVVHIDDSARLQTVNASQNQNLWAILHGHLRATGVPVLCNTSANYKGMGFFPDLRSAMTWGGVDLVWSGGVIFSKA